MKIHVDLPFQLHPGTLVHRLVGKEETLPFGLSLMTVEPGANVTLPDGERHPNTETLYVIEGVLSVFMEGESFLVGPNEALHIPSNVEHKVANPHPTPARALVVASPDWGAT